MESLGALNFAMRHADQLLAKMDFSIADAIDRTASMHLGETPPYAPKIYAGCAHTIKKHALL